MKDKFGQEVQVGDFIAYATGNSSYTHINIYEVREVQENKMKCYELAVDKHKTWDRVLQCRVDVTPEEKAKILRRTVTLSRNSFVILRYDPRQFGLE